MLRFVRLLALTLIGTLTLAVLGGALSAARAETVVLHDPSGDTRHHLGYDITRIRIAHNAQRVVFEVDQSYTPYWYDIRVDLPGAKPWKYLVSWSAYQPRKAYVFNRSSHQKVCMRRTAHTNKNQTVLRFVLPRSCFDRPRALRVKAIAWDDEFGWSDRTRWTRWASVS